MIDDPLLTVEDVAERLKCHRETIRRLLREGKLRGSQPISRRGGWRVRASEVARLERGEPALVPVRTGDARRQAALRAVRDQAERARARGDDEGAARFEAMAAELATE